MSHSHDNAGIDPHVIVQGADWDVMFGVSYSLLNWPDLSGWTATYVVFPNAGDTDLPPALALGTTAGMTISYADNTETVDTTSGITLGMSGEVIATTTLSAGAAEGAVTVSLASATGVIEGATIQVALDDGSFHLDTIQTLAGTTVTLGGPLTDPAASGKAVIIYDPNWAVVNVHLHLSKAATKILTDWGIGVYRLDLLDPFGHVQMSVSDTCCLAKGYGHG